MTDWQNSLSSTKSANFTHFFSSAIGLKNRPLLSFVALPNCKIVTKRQEDQSTNTMNNEIHCRSLILSFFYAKKFVEDS